MGKGLAGLCLAGKINEHICFKRCIRKVVHFQQLGIAYLILDRIFQQHVALFSIKAPDAIFGRGGVVFRNVAGALLFLKSSFFDIKFLVVGLGRRIYIIYRDVFARYNGGNGAAAGNHFFLGRSQQNFLFIVAECGISIFLQLIIFDEFDQFFGVLGVGSIPAAFETIGPGCIIG